MFAWILLIQLKVNIPEGSVIQGSKLSALLYTLYINKVTIIHKLINNELFDHITGDSIHCNTNIINHLASSSLIYCNNKTRVGQ